MARSRTSGRAIARVLALAIAFIASLIAGAFAGAREDGLAFLEVRGDGDATDGRGECDSRTMERDGVGRVRGLTDGIDRARAGE